MDGCEAVRERKERKDICEDVGHRTPVFIVFILLNETLVEERPKGSLSRQVSGLDNNFWIRELSRIVLALSWHSWSDFLPSIRSTFFQARPKI